MSWKKVELGRITKTQKGFAFKSSKYVEKGIPVVRVSDYTLDSISNNDLKYYPYEEKKNYLDFELHEKDVIIQTVGSWQNNPASVVGKVVRVPYYLEGALLNQNAVKLTPLKEIDNNYLFYRLKTDAFKGHVLGEARGAANQASITLDTIKSFSFQLPDYKTQKRIGDILSTYDNLIENNQKQIKLLEEVAQRLYKEWFVDLRFPGHESTKIIDGIPEGWNKGSLSNIALFKRGKTITKAQVEKGNIPVVAGGLKPAYYHNQANTVAPVITISGSGANAGYTRLYNIDVFASDCSFADSKTTPNLFFVYCFLKSNKEKVNSLQKGAAQPHVYAKDINLMNLLVPNRKLINKFCKLVAPYFEKIKILENQNKLTSQARDLLLSKLVNGELEV